MFISWQFVNTGTFFSSRHNIFHSHLIEMLSKGGGGRTIWWQKQVQSVAAIFWIGQHLSEAIEEHISIILTVNGPLKWHKLPLPTFVTLSHLIGKAVSGAPFTLPCKRILQHYNPQNNTLAL